MMVRTDFVPVPLMPDVGIAIVAHKDVFDTIWTHLLRLAKPDFQTAEVRVVVLKRSKSFEPRTVDHPDTFKPSAAPEQAYQISLDDVHF